MSSSVFCGNYEVYESNSVIMLDDSLPLRIHLAPSLTFAFDVIISIENGPGERNLEIKTDNAKREVHIKCQGFDPGAGTTQPIELATVGGKKMLMHLWTEKISAQACVRTISYTIFLQKAGAANE